MQIYKQYKGIQDMKIAFIGTGNMGGAIVKGLIKSGACKAEDLICTAKSDVTLEKLRQYNDKLYVIRDNKEAVVNSDIIVLAVKPWLINEIIDEIRPVVDLKRQIIISVAAGISLKELTTSFVPDYEQYEMERIIAEVEDREPRLPDTFAEPTLFRVVPNTGAEVLESVTFIASRGANEEQVAQICQLFSSIGYTMTIDEKLIPAGTSLASCGIAFAMRYIRAAMEGGVELGFRPAEAARIVEHTVKGAAMLLLNSQMHPEAEIDRVTTAGGITIKGLNAMEKAGFTNAVIEGLKASR